MKVEHIEILEKDNNKKGDLFTRLMGDLFHALGYGEPRFNVHKSGREIDLIARHRTENKIAVAELKAHKAKIGGDDVQKFVGSLDSERRSVKKLQRNAEVVGYFISLSGFRETAIQQEADSDNERVILLGSEKIVDELIKGRIIVSKEEAVSSVNSNKEKYTLIDKIDLLATKRGWVWVIYYSDNDGQTTTHFSIVHAEGKPLVKELADEIIEFDKKLNHKFIYLFNFFIN